MQSWNRYPALYYGLAVATGISCFYLFFPPLLLGLLGGKHVRTIGFYIIVLASVLNTYIHYNVPFSNFKVDGYGYYQCKRIRHTVSLDKGGLNYQGVLKCFIVDEKSYYNIPCYITIDNHKTRPRGDKDYIVTGRLIEIGHGLYRMKVKEWIPVEKTYNLSEIRFCLKEKLRYFLKKQIKDSISYAFFASLGTGEIENRLISTQFAKAGLNHTLAISGFHYTYLIIVLSSFLGFFFHKRTVCYFLILFISIYFFFIGETPSLNRAWIASLIYLVGYLLREENSGLNALGLALMGSLILDPMAIFHIGFQMSYLATFAILSIYPALDDLLQKIMPKRKLADVRKMSYLDQHGYILSALVRQMIAITISVNVMTIPLNLLHFHYFPLMALFFNLFFPFGITISLVGLMLGVALPYVGPYILWIVEKYSKVLLDMVFYGMGRLEVGLWVGDMSGAIAYLLVMAFIGVGFFVDEMRYRLTLKRRMV